MILSNKVNDGVLFLQVKMSVGEVDFKINYHPGTEACNARRLVQKIAGPQMQAGVRLQQGAFKKMTAEEQKEFLALQDDLQALPKGSDSFKAVQDKMEALIKPHYDLEEQAKMMAEISGTINLEQEKMLDDLLFAYATAVNHPLLPNTSLSKKSAFDTIFRGKDSAVVDEIRNEIIEFNGFLG